MTDPAVLNETRLLGSDDQIHAEPALLEAALGPKLVQPRERRGRDDRKGKYVKESTDGDWGLHSEFGEKCRSELLRDNLVSVASRVGALYVRVVLVDGEVIRRNSRQSDISSKVR